MIISDIKPFFFLLLFLSFSSLYQSQKEDKSWPTLRLLFNNILASKKPLTLHNGLVDLVFLYQNLYTDLPPSSAQFIADLYEMYSGGIIDTKYVAEYEARMPSSYLEYVFRKRYDPLDLSKQYTLVNRPNNYLI